MPAASPSSRAPRSHRLLAVGVLALLGACAAPSPPPPPAVPPPAEPRRLRVVHTNDFHGRLLPQTPSWAGGREVGGAAVLAAQFDSAAARFQGATIFLSAGDDMQGTAISNLSWGRSTIAALNAAGYDVAAFGNHEFDWGQDTLQARVRESRFPWLAANLFRAGTNEHPAWVKPWTMIRRGGANVAVIGIALPETPRIVMAGRVAGLEFRPAAPAIDQAAGEARAAGADFVIVSMHVGATCDRADSLPEAPEAVSRNCEGAMLDVANAITEPVDLFVGGHTHQRVLSTAGGIPVVEANSYGTAFSITDLERQGDSTRVVYRAVQTPWADQVDPDTAVARVVAEWEQGVRPISERRIVRFAEPMERKGDEFALGNLLADAQRTATGAHVGLVNSGSVRRDLPAGAITYGMLYELQPFQNELVTVDVTGAQLRAALEHALGAKGKPDAHIAGMTVRYDPAAPEGSRIREIRLADGRVIGPTDRVTVGTTEFVATGGDGYAMLNEGRLGRTGLVDVDALATYLESLPQPVCAPATGRWVAVR